MNKTTVFTTHVENIKYMFPKSRGALLAEKKTVGRSLLTKDLQIMELCFLCSTNSFGMQLEHLMVAVLSSVGGGAQSLFDT